MASSAHTGRLRLLSLMALHCLYVVAKAQYSNVDEDNTQDVSAELTNGATQHDQNMVLARDSDWVFDFFNQDAYHTYHDGATINANASTFPATVGNGLSMSWVVLGPCAMQPPHYHPRAANYITVVNGSIQTWMVTENNEPLVTNVLQQGQMTIFPTGSLHTMQNMGCKNATIITALSSEDPGTQTLASALFRLPWDIVNAAFGYQNISQMNGTIPALAGGVISGELQCRKLCGIDML
ncbi:spherulin-1A [Xylariaceae sp. FL1272]|nr:spherulin-1A [Xylariaceae sp. FL1272]